jgi:hypothetical protein
MGAPWPLAEPVRPDQPDPRWWHRAACSGLDTDLFYLDLGDPVPPEVKAACGACPVRWECAADEAAQPPSKRVGIHGGMNTKRLAAWATRQAADGLLHPADEPPADPIRHGTDAGYKAHRDRGEQACEPCRLAHRITNAERKARRRTDDRSAAA